MGITISHQPDFGLLAQMGYQAGMGQLHREERDRSIQLRMQEREIQAGMMREERRHQMSLERAQFGAAMNMAASDRASANRFDQQRIFNQQEQEFQSQQQRIQNENRIELMNLQNRRYRELEEERRMSLEERDIRDFYLSNAETRLDDIQELRKLGYEYEPGSDAERHYNQAMDQINRIRDDKTLEPHEKAEAIHKIVSGIRPPEITPESTGQAYDRTTHVIEDPNNPGRKIILTRDRNGVFGAMDIPEQDVPEEPSTQDQIDNLPLAERVFADPDLFLKYWQAAEKQLTSTGDGLGPVEPPSSDAIRKRMQEMLGGARPNKVLSLNPETGDLVEQ